MNMYIQERLQPCKSSSSLVLSRTRKMWVDWTRSRRSILPSGSDDASEGWLPHTVTHVNLIVTLPQTSLHLLA